MQETIRARVDAELKRKLESAAKSRGQSASHLLREYMADFVQTREEQQKRHAETLLALESIEAGRFVEGEGVFAWMDSWGPAKRRTRRDGHENHVRQRRPLQMLPIQYCNRL
jgi:predicted transcriptional regulator